MDTTEMETERRDREERNLFLEKVRPLVELTKRNLIPKVTGGLLLTLALATACKGGESEEQQVAKQTPTITPSPTATIEAMPPETPTTIPKTPTPEVPTTVPTTPTLEPSPTVIETATPPVSHIENWTENDLKEIITVDPSLSGPSQFGRTIEEDVEKIKQVLERFPKILGLSIVLTQGSIGKTIFVEDPNVPVVVRIGRDMSQLEPSLFDELGSVYDIEVNYSRLAPNYTPEEIDKLRSLREQVVKNYRNFPLIKNLFNPEKMDPHSFENQVSSYSDAIFIEQAHPIYKQLEPGKPPEVDHYWPLQEPLFAQFLKSPLLDQFAKETEGQYSPYHDFAAFMEGEKTKVDALKTTSPFYELGFEILEENAEYLHNWKGLMGVLPGLPLDSKYFDQYLEKVVITYVNLGLTDAWAQRDPRLLELLTTKQREEIETNYQKLYQAASDEIFPRAFKLVFSGIGEDETIRDYYDKLWRGQAP